MSTVPLPLEMVLDAAQYFEREGRFSESAALLERILTALPHQPEALHLAAVVAYRRDQPQEALRLMELTIAHGENTPLYHRNIAELYRLCGRFAEAENSARRAVQLNPGDPIALLNLGLVLTDRGRPGDSVALLEQVAAMEPDNASAHFGLAEALLVQGEFARGWEEYEWRFRLPGAGAQLPKTTVPTWNGAEMPDATLLLFADQGFGDGIQFGRYIPWAASRCGAVSVACSPQMQPLLQQVLPSARLFSDWREAGSFAAWCPLSGLPRLAGTTLETIPAETPYLHADPALEKRWRARLDGLVAPGLRRIGIVWAGRPTHKNDAKRSTTLDALAPLAALEDVALVVLQKGASQAQTARYRGRAPLVHLSAEITHFRDTMAVIAALDLVVTVDTSVAHLAGAMGKPVWIMLPHVAEWRWLQARGDSPWYPGMRLFRQQAPGDWLGVAGAIADALRVHQSIIRSEVFPHRGGTSRSERNSRRIIRRVLEST